MPAAAADSATAAPVTVPVAELISHTSVVIKPHYLASDSGIGSDFELVMLCVKDGRRNRKIDFSSTHLTHSLSRIENFFACAAPRVVVTYGDGKRVVAALEDAKLRRGEDHCKDRDVMLRLSAVQLLYVFSL